MVSPIAIGAIVGGSLGALQYPAKKREAARERQLNAEMMRYSPWTGMKPDRLFTPDPSLLGMVVPAALSGASFGASDVFKSNDTGYKPQDFGSVESGYTGESAGGNLPDFAPMGPSVEGPAPPPNMGLTGEQALNMGPGGARSLYARSNAIPWLYMRA